MDEKLIETIVEQVMSRLTAARGSVADAPSETDLVTEDIRGGRVLIGVSNRHAHLAPEHVEILFGRGAKLTEMRPLLQPGEYACDQTMTIVSPAGRCLGPVRILGPARKVSQVELSLSDCYSLGYRKMPPVRSSGDHSGSFGITLVGPAGSVSLSSGVIRANRHIHLHTSQAAAMGLKENGSADVRINGDRPLILLGFQVRTSPKFRAEIHLDTDDANAAGVRSGDYAQILLR
ncbi:MAG: phosphate propanoyltransferase [bacterium]|nr:phosphate propanoyltransferase [Candidatus Sumerlaeota bacterium]